MPTFTPVRRGGPARWAETPSLKQVKAAKRRAMLSEEVLFKGLKPIVYNGQEVWPIVEGGKGVAATNHASAGAWAAAGGIGTVSAVNADSYDAEGKIIPQVYHAL